MSRAAMRLLMALSLWLNQSMFRFARLTRMAPAIWLDGNGSPVVTPFLKEER